MVDRRGRACSAPSRIIVNSRPSKAGTPSRYIEQDLTEVWMDRG